MDTDEVVDDVGWWSAHNMKQLDRWYTSRSIAIVGPRTISILHQRMTMPQLPSGLLSTRRRGKQRVAKGRWETIGGC